MVTATLSNIRLVMKKYVSVVERREMPLFSIIVPVYNSGKYLKKCLDSVLEQTYSDYECILVDDGSTDNSKNICEEYCIENSKFKLFLKENGGASTARNYGIKKACGTYLVFLDSDDFMLSYGLEELSKLVLKNKPDIVVCESYDYDERRGGKIERKYLLPDSRLPAEQAFPMMKILSAPWEFVVRREFLLLNHLFFKDGIRYEDELWVPKIFIEAQKRENNYHPYYCNRFCVPNSVTQRNDISKLSDRIVVIDELLQYGKSKSSHINRIIENRCAKILTGIIIQRQKYCDDMNSYYLDKEISKKLYLLMHTRQIKYIGLYFAACILGIKTTSKILSNLYACIKKFI